MNITFSLIISLFLIALAIITIKYINEKRKVEVVSKATTRIIICKLCSLLIIAICVVQIITICSGPKRHVVTFIDPCDVIQTKESDKSVTIATVSGNYEFLKSDYKFEYKNTKEYDGAGIMKEKLQVRTLFGWLDDNIDKSIITIYQYK